MARAEKKTPSPHLRAVNPADTPPADEGVPAPAAQVPAAKTPGGSVPAASVSEEVAAPRRRTFTAEYKRRILAEVDGCTAPGAVGALLRREGLYSSHLAEWRRLRDEGALSGLSPRKRGRKAAARNPLAGEVARLQRELAKATARAERADRLLELQKKVAELFGETLPPPPPELMPPPEEEPPRRARTRRSR